MKTICLKPTTFNKRLLAKELNKGVVIAFATETVYGLGASLFNLEAIKKIFLLKNRPQDNPLIVHIPDLTWVEKLTSSIPEDFTSLAENFFPGPLTVVLPKNEKVPNIVTANKNTVAIRMPNHRHALDLLKYTNQPIVAPSANLSEKPSSTNAKHVLEDFGGKIPFILDCGTCSLGIESTVLFLSDSPYLLRPGSISKEQIEDVLKKKILDGASHQKSLSPGMKYRHYAPKAAVHLIDTLDEIKKRSFSKKRIVLSIEPVSHPNVYLLRRENLFDLFRFADREGIEEIFILSCKSLEKDPALSNRIKKAVSKI